MSTRAFRLDQFAGKTHAIAWGECASRIPSIPRAPIVRNDRDWCGAGSADNASVAP
jgi:hypothetical protein